MNKLWGFFRSKKVSVFILLGLLLGTYNHCVSPLNPPKKKQLAMTDNSQSNSSSNSNTNNNNNNNNGNNNGGGANSVAIFSTTVHPITSMRCATCHTPDGLGIGPFHAHSDATTAHDAVMNNGKVNLVNPSQSRLVRKIVDENHNCWSDCAANSAEMEAAITDWKNQMEQQGGGNNNNNGELVTDESGYLGQELDPNNAMDNGTVGFATDGATLVAPMVTGDDNGTTYIWVPNGNGGLLQNNNNAAGIGYLQFNLSGSDSYKIYGLVNSPTGSDDSFHIRVNQGQYAEWHTGTTNGFEWREVTDTNNMNPMNFFIPAGNGHTLEVRQREDGTKISKVVISNDPNVNLNDVSGALIGTLNYDLSALLGGVAVQFQIDFQEFDMYSYKFMNPRFVLNGRSLQVKNIKILVNNQFNPQHSTYTIVDKVVTPADPSASSSAMIVLKDQGLMLDRISFSFEELQLQ